MDTSSFDSFTRKIYIRASLPSVYRCWATEEGICSWFLRKASYKLPSGSQRPSNEPVEAGDHYLWEWHNWDGQESGEILQANGRDRLLFSFAGNSKVSVELEPRDNKVLLSLRQFEIPTDKAALMNTYVGCSNGWTFWLANLKAYMEHGILLNETEEDLRKVPMAEFIFVNM